MEGVKGNVTSMHTTPMFYSLWMGKNIAIY